MALPGLVCRDELFPREACRRCCEQAMERLSAREACRLTVRLPALAHEGNCEAALAEETDSCLEDGRLPDIGRLKTRFAPDPGSMPGTAAAGARLAGYGEPLAAGDAS